MGEEIDPVVFRFIDREERLAAVCGWFLEGFCFFVCKTWPFSEVSVFFAQPADGMGHSLSEDRTAVGYGKEAIFLFDKMQEICYTRIC